MKSRKVFGKELHAILDISKTNQNNDISVAEDSVTNNSLLLDINILVPGKFQPRRSFDEASLKDLSDSIKQQGILQPLVVRALGDKYEIIIGERRWRAAKIAGLRKVPIIIKNIQDETALAYGLIENIQRKDLNAIEEAIAVKRLIEEFSLTHEQIASAIGRSRVTITNLLRLLSLSEEVKQLLIVGDIEMGHARALLSLSAEEQYKTAKKITEKQLSVRETENLVKDLHTAQPLLPDRFELDKDLREDINNFKHKFSTFFECATKIRINANGRGKIEIPFNSLSQLRSLITKVEDDTFHQIENNQKLE